MFTFSSILFGSLGRHRRRRLLHFIVGGAAAVLAIQILLACFRTPTVDSVCQELEDFIQKEGFSSFIYDTSVKERCSFLTRTAREVGLLSELENGHHDVDKRLKQDIMKLDLIKHLQEFHFFLCSMAIGKPEVDTSQLKVLDNPVLTNLRTVIANLEWEVANSQVERMRQKTSRDLEHQLSKHIGNVQAKLRDPEDPTLKKLICSGGARNMGGFAYRVTFASWCLAAAISTNRSLVLTPQDYFSLTKKHFIPITDIEEQRSFETLDKDVPAWMHGDSAKEELLHAEHMYIPESLKIMEDHGAVMPPAIPSHVDPDHRLHLITSIPLAWYAGFMANYIMRPNEKVTKAFADRANSYGIDLDLKKPLKDKVITASIHVRRGNKITEREAPAQPMWKYMLLVEDWYRRMEARLGRTLPRRLFIATDDPLAIVQAEQGYPNYHVFANSTVAENSKGNQTNCYNYVNSEKDTLQWVLEDMLLLKHCDYLVGTFTSNVMTVLHNMKAVSDPTFGTLSTVSLDIDWYFERHFHSHRFIAIHDHDVPNELKFKTGDHIRSTHKWRMMHMPYSWEFLENRLPDGHAVGKNMDGNETFEAPWWLENHMPLPYPRFKVRPVIQDPVV